MMQECSGSHCSSVTGEAKGEKNASWLHSVLRNSIAKPSKKAPVAPIPPTPIKVYEVDPMNFRDLVQQLTAAPQFKPPHLQSVAPVPMPVSPFVDAPSRDIATVTSPDLSWAPKVPMSNLYLQDFQSEPMGMGLKSQEIAAPATRWN